VVSETQFEISGGMISILFLYPDKEVRFDKFENNSGGRLVIY